MAPGAFVVAEPDLRTFACDAFESMGLDRASARISADALLYSELRFHPGQGQGVRRLIAYEERLRSGLIDAAAPFEIVKESSSLAYVDAHDAPGSVTGVRAMRLAASKAEREGVGMVVVRHGTHYGSSAVHAHEALTRDCIGLAITNAGPEMAPWGGRDPVVGTNPWALAAPTDRGFPVVLDIALTTAGKGMMRYLAVRGEPMPEDWALTPDGRETTDPTAAMSGALLGIGRYKGFGLSFMTDALTGVLAGGGFGLAPYSDPEHQDVSHLFLAIHIPWFMPRTEYEARMGRLIDMVKGSRLRPGFDEVLVPGELEHRRESAKRADGVPLEPGTFQALQALGERLGVVPPAAVERAS